MKASHIYQHTKTASAHAKADVPTTTTNRHGNLPLLPFLYDTDVSSALSVTAPLTCGARRSRLRARRKRRASVTREPGGSRGGHHEGVSHRQRGHGRHQRDHHRCELHRSSVSQSLCLPSVYKSLLCARAEPRQSGGTVFRKSVVPADVPEISMPLLSHTGSRLPAALEGVAEYAESSIGYKLLQGAVVEEVELFCCASLCSRGTLTSAVSCYRPQVSVDLHPGVEQSSSRETVVPP